MVDPIQSLDKGTDYWFRNQRQNGPLDPQVFLFFDGLGSYLVLGLLALACLALLMSRHHYRSGLVFLVLLAAGLVLGEGLKLLVRSPRPDTEPWLHRTGGSFPSTSALMSCFLLLFLARWTAAHLSKWGRCLVFAPCILLILLIGTSQLFLGLHYLTDLLAGWTAGLLLFMVGAITDQGKGGIFSIGR